MCATAVGLGLVLTMACVASPAAAAGPACLALPADKVALQIYSVFSAMTGPPAPPLPGQPRRAPTATAGQLRGFFGELKAMGWNRFENFAGAWGLATPDYVAVVKASGLQAVSSHDGLDPTGWNTVLDRAAALGQTYVGSGGYGAPGIDTLEHVLQTAANLNALGEAASKRGLKLFVHSHQDEFKNRFDYDLNGDGRPQNVSAWEIVAARTNPQLVSFEVDVGWAYVAFGPDRFDDLLRFLQSHRDRIVMLHVKDIAGGKLADLGRGEIDYARVVAAAGPQIAYYVWEYDQPPQPMASARIAHDYMTCAGR